MDNRKGKMQEPKRQRCRGVAFRFAIWRRGSKVTVESGQTPAFSSLSVKCNGQKSRLKYLTIHVMRQRSDKRRVVVRIAFNTSSSARQPFAYEINATFSSAHAHIDERIIGRGVCLNIAQPSRMLMRSTERCFCESARVLVAKSTTTQHARCRRIFD